MSYSGHGKIHLAWGDLKAEVGDLAITVVVLHFTKVSERTPGHARNHHSDSVRLTGPLLLQLHCHI